METTKLPVSCDLCVVAVESAMDILAQRFNPAEERRKIVLIVPTEQRIIAEEITYNPDKTYPLIEIKVEQWLPDGAWILSDCVNLVINGD